MLKVLTIFGTRPEAIKLAPVLIELGKKPLVHSIVCVTAQHRQMLDHVLSIFDIVPDIDLDLMRVDQQLPDLTANVITQVYQVIRKISPNLVLVQGDTTTVMASAIATFYHKIPLGHVEAGLRTGNIESPFPEEINRQITSLIACYHFAPTETAKQALLKENIPSHKIYTTGNPVIDALELILSKRPPHAVKSILTTAGFNNKSNSKKLVLVTAHRRENFGKGIENICAGLKSLASRNEDISILYPVHLNPNIREPVFRILNNIKNVFLIDPVEYDVMAYLMKAAYVILTDSGGIQEEAPALGKPVLVLRRQTERPEAVEAGTAKLIGPDANNIIAEAEYLLKSRTAYQQMACIANPYGDGQAAKRIIEVIVSAFNIKKESL